MRCRANSRRGFQAALARVPTDAVAPASRASHPRGARGALGNTDGLSSWGCAPLARTACLPHAMQAHGNALGASRGASRRPYREPAHGAPAIGKTRAGARSGHAPSAVSRALTRRCARKAREGWDATGAGAYARACARPHGACGPRAKGIRTPCANPSDTPRDGAVAPRRR